MKKEIRSNQANTCTAHMFWIRIALAEPVAEVSIYIVWCVMSASISRQQMVTVCLLNFSTTRSNTHTLIHPRTCSHTSTVRTSTTQRENKQIHTLSITLPPSDKIRYCTPLAYINFLFTNMNPHTHLPVTKAWLYQPWHQCCSCRWEGNCGWQIDWKIFLTPSSIISACLSSSCCSIHLLERETKPFRPALTIKSPRGVLDNTQPCSYWMQGHLNLISLN